MAAELKHTVMPSGGDFTGLQACIDHIVAAHADLVSADLYASIEIGGTWSSADTTAVVIPATVLASATCYLKIYTTAAARHNGAWDTGAYILQKTNGTTLINNCDYVWLDGLQIETASAAATRYCISMNNVNLTATNNWFYISNSIIKGHGHATYDCHLIRLDEDNVNAYVWNTIGFNNTAASGNYGVYVAGCASVKIGSSVFIGGEYGIRRYSGGTVTAKNCYCGGALTADYGGTITKTTCASSDTTGDTGLQSIPVSAATFVNVGAGTEDYHLAVGSALIGVGTDTSGDAAPMNFTVDIDGDSRV
jgi:hypothetical protein